MSGQRRAALVAALVAAAGWLAGAQPTAACSCVQTQVTDYVGHPEYAIFTGTALEQRDLTVPFVVEEWFQGSPPQPAVLLATGQERMPDGVISADTCGRVLVPGRWLVFAVPEADGRYDPGSCSLTASLGDADGQRLLAEVRARLTGLSPPTAAPTDAPGDAAAGSTGTAPLLYVAVPLAAGLLLFAVLVVLARRRAR